MTAHQKDVRGFVAALGDFAEKPKRTRKPPTLSEAHIEQACTQLLELDGWRALKTNPVSNRARGAGFGELGMADCLYIRYPFTIPQEFLNRVPGDGNFSALARSQCPQVMWIEWKCKGGKTASHQHNWHVLERKRGALTLIAGVDFEASIEGFKAWYLASGLNRRIIP